MENTSRVRAAGMCGIVGSLLWIVAILIEYGFGLQPPNNGALFYINQAIFFVAQAGWVVAIIGLIRARAAGDGWFGKLALGLFALGWIVLLVALPLGLITRNPNLPLYPIGGLTSTIGGVLAGIAVATARRWHGWQRWSVLFYALYYLIVLFLPIVIADREPTMLTELIWGLAWLPIGFALLSSGSRQTRPAIA